MATSRTATKKAPAGRKTAAKKTAEPKAYRSTLVVVANGIASRPTTVTIR